MRIAFMGTPDFAAVALRALIDAGHEIAAVYCQPARPAGRGQKPQPSAVEKLATAEGLEVRTPKRVRDAEEIQRFADLKLDAAVVAAYGLILPQEILDAPTYGCFNIHGSILPRWRGAAPIHRAILAGDTETGVTIMQMDVGLDTGDMLKIGRVPITPVTTGGALHDQLAILGAQLMAETLAEIDALTPVKQPEEGVTYAAKIDKAEMRLDWSLSTDQLDRTIRVFAPRPGAFTEILGERVKVLAAEIVKSTGEPGCLLDDALTVATADGALRLTQIQRAGGKPLAAKDVLRGWSVPAGTRIG
ncbi:methionyl-tRNA formyltransferase [Lacibacterium aquatile]|uniref:Methionyl-tRNA formyltransferase n=1 Tax=Lacibacterium aquatile TaxID=1168082 RepID=A0ABW5DKR1_9PROT